MKKILPIVLILMLFQYPCLSQNKTMVSLKTALQNSHEDTARLRIYLSLGNSCETKDILLYAEPALKLADKLLSQNPDTKERKRILEQKAGAYDLMVGFYSEGNKADLNKVLWYGEKILEINNETGDRKGVAQWLSDIAGIYKYNGDTAKFLEYAQKSLSTYIENKDTANIVNVSAEFSRYYLSIGNFPKALESIQKALSISKEMNYKRGIALCLLQIADVYRDNGENTQALENYQTGLSILYKINDTSALYSGLAAIAGYYYKLNNIKKALEFYYKVISLCEAKKDMKDRVSSVYKWIGQVYRDNKEYTNSLLNYEKSLLLFEKIKNKERVKEVLDAIGLVYNEQGNFTKALEYHFKALQIAEELKSQYGIALSYLGLARAYRNQKNYKSAKDYSAHALTILKKQFDITQISEAELLASEIDSASGNGMGALAHYKEYVILSNKLKGDEIHKAAQKEKYESEYAQQKAIDEAQQEKKDAIAKGALQQEQTKRYALYGGLVLLIIFGGFMFNRFRVTQKQKLVIEKQKRIVEKEKQRSDGLLLNILPAEVAEELKEKGSAEAKQFDQVTVMFTDFKGFTQISEKLSPSELVAEIHTCFKAFDNIITQHNIEKIKTIGDSYMCAGGLPVTNKTNATDVVEAALKIQQFMQQHLQQRNNSGKEPFEIRIGIHTGPVVAGIVGVKKFAYDIWGDAVNIASRMESSGEAGKVNISGETYELVKDRFICTHRGKIQAKNKGQIDMYFVESFS